MTFDLWWKEHGSLQHEIFNLSHDAREVFKRISQTAWEESERITIDKQSDYEEKLDKLEAVVSKLKEDLESTKQQRQDALDDIEILKESIRSCL